MDRSDAVFALALVFAGIIFPGVLDYLLHRAGYPLAGKLTWVLGMAVLVVGVWTTWLRHVDLRGPIE